MTPASPSLRRSNLATFRVCLGLGLLVAGCAQGAGEPDLSAGRLPADLAAAADLGDGVPDGEGLAAETILRVHYPLGTPGPMSGGLSLSVRGSGGSLTWTSGAAMTRLDDKTAEYRLRLRAPIEWKPLIGDATWSRGANYRAEPGQTVDIYPHFTSGKGTWSRRYPAFRSATLGNDRGVWVYLPPSYGENTEARYPVLYMHDGQNLFDPRAAFAGQTWRVPETLDAGIDALDASLHLPEVIVVGPENAGAARIYEYTPTRDAGRGDGGGGDLYLKFLVEELKPVIDRDLRTLPAADKTALAGSSLGGLITAYAGIKRGDVFGRAGVFSPSTWWDERFIVSALAKSGMPRPRRVYLDCGDSGPSSDGVTDTRDLAATYRSLGYRDDVDFRFVVEAGGTHDEPSWARRLPAALRFLLAGL